MKRRKTTLNLSRLLVLATILAMTISVVTGCSSAKHTPGLSTTRASTHVANVTLTPLSPATTTPVPLPKREDATSQPTSASVSMSAPTLSTLSEPMSTPTAIRSIVSQGSDVDNACRQTIEEYFAIPCGDWETLRALYIPASQDRITSDSWTCDVAISKTLLSLLPVSEWWQQQYSDRPRPLPQSACPTASNEYVYFVEYTLHWAPGMVPACRNPASFLMWMVVDENGACKIRTQGW